MKTLRLTDITPLHSHLEITTMEHIETRRNPTEPIMHKHDYYVMIWVQAGEGVHTIDFNEYPITPNSCWFLSPGQAHFLQLHTPPKGYVISFDADFFGTVENNYELLTTTGLFHNVLQFKPFFLDPADAPCIEQSIASLWAEYQNNAVNFKEEMLRTWLKILLIQFARCLAKQVHTQEGVEYTKASCLVKRFQELVEKRFTEKNRVADYADLLNVTPSHLNDTVKKMTGIPASEHIKQRVILEIKRKAHFGSLSAKEIAFTLGFEDEAHFSKYFKNNTGQTFSSYKKSLLPNHAKATFSINP